MLVQRQLVKQFIQMSPGPMQKPLQLEGHPVHGEEQIGGSVHQK